MKPLSKLALSGMLVLGALSASPAATYTLHLTGSTAFRAATINAIVNYLYAQAGVDPVGAYKGASINGASQQVFKGSINSGADTLIVETDWTGSCQGIYDTANANALSSAWIDGTNVSNTMSTVTHAVAPGQVSGGTSLASPVFAAATAPDVNMSDVWQASTLFPTPAQTEVLANGVGVQGFVVCASKPGTSGSMPTAFVANAIPGTITAGSNVVSCSSFVASQMKIGYTLGATPVTSGQPNVPPFAICTGVGASSYTMSVAAAGTGTATVGISIAYPGWTNITAEQCRALYTNGSASLPLSQFTGAPADNAGAVIAIGRSPDSGTRVCFTEEIGVHNETAGNQIYQVGLYDSSNNLITNSTTQVAAINPFPAQTFDGVSLSAGDYGYTSGGNVQAVLDNPTLFNVKFDWFLISPLGVSDATNCVNGGGTALTFNGVPYNQVYMEQGEYPLWSYEHMYKSSTLSGQGLTSAQGIASQMSTSDAVINGDLISNMSVYRSPITTDGAPIFNDLVVSL